MGSQVFESAWSGTWQDASPVPGAIAAPGSAITCFGVNGADSRVYYFDKDHYVNESAWPPSGWSSGRIKLSGGQLPPFAASKSGLACYGAGGSASRVYYVDSQGLLHELEWEGFWAQGPIGATAQ
jgi:hypothetical protein